MIWLPGNFAGQVGKPGKWLTDLSFTPDDFAESLYDLTSLHCSLTTLLRNLPASFHNSAIQIHNFTGQVGNLTLTIHNPTAQVGNRTLTIRVPTVQLPVFIV
jgi:hypothetical protein